MTSCEGGSGTRYISKAQQQRVPIIAIHNYEYLYETKVPYETCGVSEFVPLVRSGFRASGGSKPLGGPCRQ